MALIKASGVTDKKASNIVSDDRLGILRRDLRSFSLKDDNLDRVLVGDTDITIIENSDGTFDIKINWKVDFHIGSHVEIELQTKERTTLSSTSSTNSNSSHTFEDVDTQTSFVVIWIENSGDYRVSDRFLFSVVVDTNVGHNSLPSYANPGSEYDVRLIQKEEDDIRETDLGNQASLVLDLFKGHHNQLVDIETHVDIIFGALSNFSSDPLVEQDVEDASKPASDTDLFPRDREEFYPKNPDWVTPGSFEDATASNIQYYNSPHGSSTRTAGDQSEWQDLDQAITNNNFPVTIFNETTGQDVTYNDSTEAENRKDEIEQIVKDFNNEQTVWDEYDQRYDYIDHYTNRITGYRLQERLLKDVSGITDQQTNQSDDFESEFGLTQ